MSGKRSKQIRKNKILPKKVLAGAAAAVLCATPVASEGGEFLVSLYPNFSFPVLKFDDSLATGFGGGLRLAYKPTEVFNVFVQGDYTNYSFDTKQNIGDVSVFGGKLGAGYTLPLTDRLGLNFDAGIGYYYASYQKGQGSNKTSTGIPGLSVNGSISISYKLGPVVSVFAGGGAEHLAYKNSKFITSANVTPGLTVNLTRAFNNKTNVSVESQNLKPVFPVFYSWYNDNTFGSVEVTNEEDSSITDVNVYFYQPQYMNQPKNCGQVAKLKKGEKMYVDLKAFFNEQMLSLNEKTDTLSSIIVEYKYLGAKRSATFPMVVPVYGRNNMSWEDDRCASAFVSSKDPAAMWFAKNVVSSIRDNIRSGVPQNIQYAMGVFEALDQFGINYVKDPASAFEDNVGTASIDFLQFPYQTLLYRGGDCDDLSILVCSLLESIGIRTAFITIPGHIYMSFDSGFTLEEAKNYFLTLDEFIVDGNEVWVPLEITLSDEGFNSAWHKGAWEWNTAYRSGTARMYKMADSWEIYKPVSVPGATAHFTLPDEASVAKVFSDSVDEFVINQITPQIAWYENRLATAPTAQNYNDFGVLYARYGLFERAENQFRIARRMNYLPAYLNTANLCYSEKDYTGAQKWYKEVLSRDKNNSLAMLGLARCAYETDNFQECDYWYGTVYKNDRSLARRYSYLGAFESTGGRSFSLADRLENTVWLQSTDYNMRNASGSGVQGQTYSQTTGVVLNTTVPAPGSGSVGSADSVVAVVPSVTNGKNKNDEEEQNSGAGADGDDDNKPYTGISSQLDFNILSAKDLAVLAQDTILENGETLDDFDFSAQPVSIRDDKIIQPDSISPVPESAVTKVMTDVPLRAVDGQQVIDNKAAVPENKAAVPELVEGQAVENKLAVVEQKIESVEEKIAAIEQKIAMIEKETTVVVKKDTKPVVVKKEPVVVEKDTTPAVKSEPAVEVKKDTTVAVPEPVEGPQTTAVIPAVPEPVEGVEGPQTPDVLPDPVEGVEEPSPKKSNKKIYFGFAALTAALTALFIGLKKKRKEK